MVQTWLNEWYPLTIILYRRPCYVLTLEPADRSKPAHKVQLASRTTNRWPRTTPSRGKVTKEVSHVQEQLMARPKKQKVSKADSYDFSGNGELRGRRRIESDAPGTSGLAAYRFPCSAVRSEHTGDPFCSFRRSEATFPQAFER